MKDTQIAERTRRDRLWSFVWPDAAGSVRGEHPALKTFVLVQLAAILALGIFTITSFQIWAPVDEHAHFDYVQDISDRHVLPTLDPRIELGKSFGAHTYEGFQPPLYYIVAAPLLKLSHVHHTRIMILRSFGLFLLLVTVYLAWRLALMVFPARPLMPFAFALAFFLLPGVIVRSVTVSYQPLATLLAVAFLLLILKADRAPKDGAERWLVAAGVVLALAALTHVLLAYLAGVFAIVALRRLRTDRFVRLAIVLVGTGALAGLLVLPWVAFNWSHYHSLTANLLARRIQQPLINPKNRDYTLGYVPQMTGGYVRDFFLPNEWTPLTTLYSGVHRAVWAMAVLFFVVPAALYVVRPRKVRSDVALVLGLAFVLNLVFVEMTSLAANWPSFGRYVYGSVAAWMLFAFAAVQGTLRYRAASWVFLVLAAAGAGYLWVEGALRYL